MSRKINSYTMLLVLSTLMLFTGCNSKRAERGFIKDFVPAEELETPTPEPTATPDNTPMRPTGEDAIRVDNTHCVCISNQSADVNDCEALLW